MKTLYSLLFLLVSAQVQASELPPCPDTQTLISEMVKKYQGPPNAEQIKQTMKKRMTNCFGSTELITDMEYVGEWKDGNFHGEGKSVDKNKNKYEGQFINNFKDGFGEMVFVTGGSYKGEWKLGEPNGQGTFISNSGEKFVGGFRGSQWFGQGTLTLLDGNNITGLWYESNFVPALCERAGIPQSSPEHSKCIMRYMNKIDE